MEDGKLSLIMVKNISFGACGEDRIVFKRKEGLEMAIQFTCDSNGNGNMYRIQTDNYSRFKRLQEP